MVKGHKAVRLAPGAVGPGGRPKTDEARRRRADHRAGLVIGSETEEKG